MSQESSHWFHCGHCGVLFESSLHLDQPRQCSGCGKEPAIASDLAPFSRFSLSHQENPAEPQSRAEKKRQAKIRLNWLMIGFGWILLIGLIVFGAKWLWQDDSRLLLSERQSQEIDSPIDEAEIQFRREAVPLCKEVLLRFISATTVEAKSQFVANSVTQALPMAKYYALNPTAAIDPATLRLNHLARLKLPTGDALETIWVGPENAQYGAVFVKQEGEWRLDWSHFVRFSNYPWELFLAGSGESVNEFRLLARQRTVTTTEPNDPLNIVLYAPRFGTLVGLGSQSAKFSVPRDCENGRLLEAAFKLEREQRRAFDSRMPNVNPEHLIQVRAQVRRVNNDNERLFVLEKVIVCHWYAEDAMGMELPQALPNP